MNIGVVELTLFLCLGSAGIAGAAVAVYLILGKRGKRL
jgi:hypothetical protein